MDLEKKHLPSIDFLRGFTAIFVCMYHFINYSDANGTLFTSNNLVKQISSFFPNIVVLFFFLSGFVIVMSMEKQGFQFRKIGNFLLRRFIRIEIPYLASIAVYILFALLWAIHEQHVFHIDWSRLFYHLTYSIAFSEHHWYNDIYWTLAIEFQFYILIALLFPLFQSKLIWLKFGSLALFGASFFILKENALVFAYSPYFVLGIATYYFMKKDNMQIVPGLFMLASLMVIFIYFDWQITLFLCVGLGILYLPVKYSNKLVHFGKTGYSFYLMHGAFGGTFLYFVMPMVTGVFSRCLIMLAAIIIAIFCSYLFYLLIELPSLKWAKRINIGETNNYHDK